MSETIKLWGFGDNDRSGKVRWTAYELGLDVEEIRVELGRHRKSPYRDLNPYAQIPTVEFRGETLIESTAACQFIAESVGTPNLVVAPGSDNRQQFLFWCSFFTETTEPRLVEAVLGKAGVLPPEYFDLHERLLKFKLRVAAERLPPTGFLCGPEFTLADIFAGYSLRLALRVNLVDRETVMPYLDQLRSRPAAKQSRFFGSMKDA